MELVKSITKKRQMILILLVLFLFASLAYSAEPKKGYRYVGSVNDNKYHYFKCKWAKKIYQRDSIYFKDANQASTSGYRPCKACRPPKKD